jgi:glycosyltransferase involved in cell wall biosynthesis
MVTAFAGDPTVEERAAAAADGRQPRKDFLEVAGRLADAVIVDAHYMRDHACRRARAVARLAGLPAGQVVEVFLRRRRFGHVLAWADRLGVPLALLFKLRRSHTDLVLISALLTRGVKAFLVRRLRVHTHLRAILVRRLQRDLLVDDYGVPSDKLVLDRFGVDERFFTPGDTDPPAAQICAIGWEERDYVTLFRAAAGIDAEVELAVGSIAMATESEAARRRIAALLGADPPPNVRITRRNAVELRELYRASRCVVVPVREAEFDAGVTATMEAMACGRPVVASRTEGLTGLFRDGVEGLYVAPGDADELRAALVRLLADRAEAERMGRAARALVERDHRLDERVERIVVTLLSDATSS